MNGEVQEFKLRGVGTQETVNESGVKSIIHFFSVHLITDDPNNSPQLTYTCEGASLPIIISSIPLQIQEVTTKPKLIVPEKPKLELVR